MNAEEVRFVSKEMAGAVLIAMRELRQRGATRAGREQPVLIIRSYCSLPEDHPAQRAG